MTRPNLEIEMNNWMFDYSEAELRLIKSISEHWFRMVKDTDVDPITVYRILATICFEEDRKGPAVEALRRVMVCIRECKIYRMTPEFDKLCAF